MKISEVMTAGFETIDSTNSLIEAAKKMKSLDVGILPVQEGTRLIGVVTDRDIVIRALADDRNPGETQVKDVISPNIVYCFEDDSVEDAVKLMEENQVRRLIVCREDGTPIGIVSLGDLAVRSGQEQLFAEALEQISEPAGSAR